MAGRMVGNCTRRLLLAAPLLMALLTVAAEAHEFDVTIDARFSQIYHGQGYTMIMDVIDNHYIAEDSLAIADPFQDATGRIHVPIGYPGDLVVTYAVRYVNDTAETMTMYQTNPYGFAHSIGEATLNHPWPDYPQQGTFTYHWTVSGPEDITLAPGDSTVRPFFIYELIDTFGPTIPAVTTEWGQSWPTHELVVGDGSRLVWQVIGGEAPTATVVTTWGYLKARFRS